MTDLQTQVEMLEKAFAQLKAAQESQQPDDHDSVRGLTRLLREDLAKEEEKTANLGILRSVVLHNRQGGSAVNSATFVCGHADRLPSAEAFVGFVTTLASEPLGLRVIHALLARHFDGLPLQQTKAELAVALGVAESALEHALLPLIDKDIIRWSKNGQAQEYYVLNRPELAVLISFAG